jgi:hypothetical protein
MVFKMMKIQKRVGKRGLSAGAMVILMMALVSAARGENKRPSWNVALFGGGIFGRNGDAGMFIREYDRYYQTMAEAYQTTKSGSLNWPGIGTEFGAEIGYSLSPRLSVGVAVERLSKNMEGSFTLGSWAGDHLMSGTAHAMEMTLSATSISVFGCYSLPLAKAVSIAGRAGFGILSGTLDRVLLRRYPDISDEWMLTGEYSASGLTGQAGLGVMWDLSRQFALHFEGGYRLASLSNWSGRNTYAMGPESEFTGGDLNYLELQGDERNPAVYHPSLAVGDPNIILGLVSSRACKTGFTGFFFKAGFVVRFGR